MKKLISIMIFLFIGLSVAGCSSQSASQKETINGYTLEELKDLHEVMFTLTNSNSGETDISSDYWCYDSITVSYDGTVILEKIYNLSGAAVHLETELTEDDYQSLLDFLEKDFVKGKCDIEVDACDGNTWRFIYYSPDGEELHKFHGYSYGIEKLENIQSMLYSYMPEYEAPPLYPDA